MKLDFLSFRLTLARALAFLPPANYSEGKWKFISGVHIINRFKFEYKDFFFNFSVSSF